MSLNRRYRVVSGVVLLCAACLSSGANAETAIVDSVPVKYVQADLATPAGAKKLYWRIQRAAQTVCHKPEVRELFLSADYRNCYENAVDHAVAEVNASELTALHRNRTQRGAAG